MVYSLSEIKNIVQPIAEKYCLKEVFLFGSYARGEATENSDIDLLLDLSGTEIRSLFTLGAVYSELVEALHKEVDLITVSALEQREQLSSDISFRNNVNHERVSLYAVA